MLQLTIGYKEKTAHSLAKTAKIKIGAKLYSQITCAITFKSVNRRI